MISLSAAVSNAFGQNNPNVMYHFQCRYVFSIFSDSSGLRLAGSKSGVLALQQNIGSNDVLVFSHYRICILSTGVLGTGSRMKYFPPIPTGSGRQFDGADAPIFRARMFLDFYLKL